MDPTESDWLAGADPGPMLPALVDRIHPETCERKLRLFAAACCRRVWELLSPTCRVAVEAAERFADMRATADDLHDTWAAVRAGRSVIEDEADTVAWDADLLYKAAEAVAVEADNAYHHSTPYMADAEEVAGCVTCAFPEPTWAGQRAFHADYLRDVIGNPFCLPELRSEWRTEAVLGLARGIDADRAYDRLPVLADSLEEAGCTDPDVLGHCRGPGPYIPGCWVVDLLLGWVKDPAAPGVCPLSAMRVRTVPLPGSALHQYLDPRFPGYLGPDRAAAWEAVKQQLPPGACVRGPVRCRFPSNVVDLGVGFPALLSACQLPWADRYPFTPRWSDALPPGLEVEARVFGVSDTDRLIGLTQLVDDPDLRLLGIPPAGQG